MDSKKKTKEEPKEVSLEVGRGTLKREGATEDGKDRANESRRKSQSIAKEKNGRPDLSLGKGVMLSSSG